MPTFPEINEAVRKTMEGGPLRAAHLPSLRHERDRWVQQTASSTFSASLGSGACEAICSCGTNAASILPRPAFPKHKVRYGGRPYMVAVCHRDWIEKTYRPDRILRFRVED